MIPVLCSLRFVSRQHAFLADKTEPSRTVHRTQLLRERANRPHSHDCLMLWFAKVVRVEEPSTVRNGMHMSELKKPQYMRCAVSCKTPIVGEKTHTGAHRQLSLPSIDMTTTRIKTTTRNIPYTTKTHTHTYTPW